MLKCLLLLVMIAEIVAGEYAVVKVHKNQKPILFKNIQKRLFFVLQEL